MPAAANDRGFLPVQAVALRSGCLGIRADPTGTSPCPRGHAHLSQLPSCPSFPTPVGHGPAATRSFLNGCRRGASDGRGKSNVSACRRPCLAPASSSTFSQTALLEAAAIWVSSCVRQSALFQVRGPSPVCVSRPGPTPNHSAYTSPAPRTQRHARVHTCTHMQRSPLQDPCLPLCLTIIKVSVFPLLPNLKLPAGRNPEDFVF